MKKILNIILALCVSTLASSRTYWCTPQGTMDGTSYMQAGSFTALVQGLVPGDTLFMRGGQYDCMRKNNIPLWLKNTSRNTSLLAKKTSAKQI